MKNCQIALNKLLGRYNKGSGLHWKHDRKMPPIRPNLIRNVDQSNLSHYERHLISPFGAVSKKFTDLDSDFRKPYRILALDGGGIRSIVSCAILERIVAHNPNFMTEVDFVIGTSAGGILALLLASGYTPSECSEIFRASMPHIFGADPLRSMNPFRSKYCDNSKEEILKHYLDNRTLDKLDKACAVVSFKIDGGVNSRSMKKGWSPAIFSNLPSTLYQKTSGDMLAWEAGMRTSAAPTYFPIYNGYVDGGVVANNPSVLGVSKALKHYPKLDNGNVFVLSIGTGCWPDDQSLTFGTNGDYDWGLRQWIPHLLDLLLEGDNVTIDMLMNYLLGNGRGYHRVDPELEKRVALDSLKDMDRLYDMAMYQIDLSSTLNYCDKYFKYTDYSSTEDNMVNNAIDRASSYYHAWEQSVLSNRP